jgi:hypothetical protein
MFKITIKEHPYSDPKCIAQREYMIDSNFNSITYDNFDQTLRIDFIGSKSVLELFVDGLVDLKIERA